MFEAIKKFFEKKEEIIPQPYTIKDIQEIKRSFKETQKKSNHNIVSKEIFYVQEPWLRVTYSNGRKISKPLIYADEPIGEDVIDTHEVMKAGCLEPKKEED